MQAAILQRAVDYIDELHRHKQQLVAKNQRLAHLLGAATAAAAAAGSGNGPEVTSSWRWEDGATPGRAAACGVWRRRRAELERRDAAAAVAVAVDDDEAEDLRVASVPQSAATLPVDAAAAAQQSLPPRTVYTYRTTTALCSKKRPPFLFFQELCQKKIMCLQCFDAVGWAAGRASGL